MNKLFRSIRVFVLFIVVGATFNIAPQPLYGSELVSFAVSAVIYVFVSNLLAHTISGTLAFLVGLLFGLTTDLEDSGLNQRAMDYASAVGVLVVLIMVIIDTLLIYYANNGLPFFPAYPLQLALFISVMDYATAQESSA